MTNQDRAVCAGCGQTIEISVAPNRRGLCERCAELAPFLADDPALLQSVETAGAAHLRRRNSAVGRLRERYHEARALSPSDPEDSHHINLDWILGSDAGDGRGAPFDERASALVVLWLEDLLRELDVAVAAAAPVAAGSPEPRRDAAARRLRSATRDFADAFLGLGPDPASDACQP